LRKWNSNLAQDAVAPRHQDEKAAGAAALMVDVRKHWAVPLDDTLLARAGFGAS